MDQVAVRMGDYVELGVKSALERNVLDNSDRLRRFANGTSFDVYKSKINELPVVVKMLKGSPSTVDQALYPHKPEFQLHQLQVVVRETRFLAHPPLRRHENIPSILKYGFNTQGRDIDETEEDEGWMKIQPFIVLEYAEHGTLREFLQLPYPLICLGTWLWILLLDSMLFIPVP